MTRELAFALDLADEPELIARYRAWHAPGAVPAPVVRAIRAAGIEHMAIWITGPRLFMTMRVGPDFSPAAKALADAADPDVQAWERLMDGFQRPLPWAVPGEKWTPATRIFDLDAQPRDPS